VKIIPNSSQSSARLRIERGELVDGKEKSSKEKISEEKEALSPTLD
jgi:hypothetical protein